MSKLGPFSSAEPGDLQREYFKKAKWTNTMELLRRRELGMVPRVAVDALVGKTYIQRRIDESSSRLYKLVSQLRRAIDPNRTKKVDALMTVEMVNTAAEFLKTTEADMQSPDDKSLLRVQIWMRDFVSLGGMEIVLSVFEEPHTYMPFDARNKDSKQVSSESEFWTPLLYFLKDFLYYTALVGSIPGMYVSTDCITQLFTMAAHDRYSSLALSCADLAMGYTREIFDLSRVPRVHALIRRMSTRDMAVFTQCMSRLVSDEWLSLEGDFPAGKSVLQLRRDRMASTTKVVDRNQALLLSAPDFLEKLILLLKISNYGPDVGDMVRNEPNPNLIDHMADYVSTTLGRGRNEWDLFPILLMTCEREDAENVAKNIDKAEGEEESMRRLFAAFSPGENDENSMLTMDSNISSVIVDYGIPRAGFRIEDVKANQARKILQFRAFLYTGMIDYVMHAVVNLLSGRRKIYVQEELDNLGLRDCLLRMHTKLSWEDDFSDVPKTDHKHGPNCNCPPEHPGAEKRSSYVRLVSRFLERDFVNNDMLNRFLSAGELRLLSQGPDRILIEGVSLAEADRGLMSHIITAYRTVSASSSCRYFLMNCIQSFARGSNIAYKLLASRNGLLEHTVRHILSTGARAEAQMDGEFDLLAELVKFNPKSLQLISACMDEHEFTTFFEIARSNLVESNVFLRALVLTLYPLPAYVTPHASERPCYLSHSWAHFRPARKDGTSTFGVNDNFDWKHYVAAMALDGDDEALNAHLMRLRLNFECQRVPVFIAIMESVTMHTIYHNNICCVNTALFFMVVEALHGRLAIFLSDIGEYITNHIKKKRGGSSANSTPLRGAPARPDPQGEGLESAASSEGDGDSGSGSSSSSSSSSSSGNANENHDHSVSINRINGCNASDRDHHEGDASGKDSFWFKNFRELLWFWQEYYQRRGRDRMSLEFCSEIPFHVLQSVVGRLCADDGSDTALLSAPMDMPLSPYHMPPTAAPPQRNERL